MVKHGLMRRNASKDYESHQTIYNRFTRLSRLSMFNRIFAAPAAPCGRAKGGMNSNLHAVRDGEGRPIMLLLAEG